MSQMCTTIKQNGIIIYTILFNNNTAATQTLFRNCASSPSNYFLSRPEPICRTPLSRSAKSFRHCGFRNSHDRLPRSGRGDRCASDSMMEVRNLAGCAGTDGERAHVMIGAATPLADGSDVAEQIRVRGLVQGVGFRPAVWRLARRHGLRGWVANDGDGVTIRLRGAADAIARFVGSLPAEAPPLARIDRIERTPGAPSPQDAAFHIADSMVTRARTGVVPDAATCPHCRAEVFDAFARRYRYPFANCTHCGPRLSIIQAIPYDRHATTMRAFDLCPACAGEYHDPNDRRFHAQPIACPACGPRAWLERGDGRPVAMEVDTAATLLMRGQILAIKGLGGFQLACDATNPDVVARLRARKRRPRKPLALMVRDLDVARAYCAITAQEADILCSAAAPIVITTPRNGDCKVAGDVAPGMHTLGVMLPNTPLHHLMLRRIDRPIVLTSGNRSDEPQCIDRSARDSLGGIADAFLMHDRDIARRVDDSIVRIMSSRPRVMRVREAMRRRPCRCRTASPPRRRFWRWVAN
jgi:hydrogenase maturation protein HypF